MLLVFQRSHEDDSEVPWLETRWIDVDVEEEEAVRRNENVHPWSRQREYCCCVRRVILQEVEDV